MISAYIDAPTFTTNTEVSATDINTLRTNSIILDALSLRGKQGFPSMHKASNWNASERSFLKLWRGGFKYMTGITTATFRLLTITDGPEEINIYFKRESDSEDSIGTLVYNGTDPNNPAQYNVDIDISGLGYNMNEVIEVLVSVENGGAYTPKTGVFQVLDAYVHPLSGITFWGTYPGLPTFTGDTNISASDLNQMSNTSDWLMRRLRLAPRIPMQRLLFWPGTHKAEQYPLFRGSVMRSNSADVVKIPITYYSYNVEDYIKIYINYVLVGTLGPFTVGDKGHTNFYYDMSGSYTNKTTYALHIDNVPISGNPVGQTYNQNSIFHIGQIEMVPAGFAYDYATPATITEELESMTFLELKNRLQDTSDVFSAIKARIDDQPEIWNRQQMFRRRFSNDDHQENKWARLQIASLNRIGNTLLVRGKGIKIAWGGLTIAKDFQTMQMEDPNMYSFSNEEELIDGENIQTKLVYLNQFKGLFPGNIYHITGKDLIYAAEYFNSN